MRRTCTWCGREAPVVVDRLPAWIVIPMWPDADNAWLCARLDEGRVPRDGCYRQWGLEQAIAGGPG